MNKNKSIVLSKSIPMYKGKLIVIISNKHKFVNKHVFFEPSSELYAHCIYDNYKGNQGFFIILNPKNEIKLTFGVIVHEILHCVNFIMEARGQHASRENDEADAYLAEWIGNFVFKSLKQNNIKL